MNDRLHPAGAAVLALATASGLAGRAGGQVRYDTIALSGDHAPGTPVGVNYANLSTPVNEAGQVAYLTGLTGSGVTPGTNSAAIYAGSFAAPQLVARPGDPAPGMPAGVNYSFGNGDFKFTPPVNDAGHVAFRTGLTGSGVTTANDQAIYAGGGAAGPQLVAREGAAAPGTPPGVNYWVLGDTPVLNDAGDVAYVTFLTGSGVTTANDRAMYAGGFAAPQLVARERDAAPGMPAGVHYLDFGDPALNDAGHVAYRAFLSGTGVTTANDDAIYAGGFAAPQLIARQGDGAPGTPTGVSYAELGGPILNDAGHVAYRAFLTGSGVTGTNDRAIYAGGLSAPPQLVARTGDAAPGTPAGVNYADLGGRLALNDTGQVAYGASLTGNDVTFANNDAIYAGDIANPQLVAREGDAAPGTPAGVNYASFFTVPALNDDGQVAYGANLSGSGVTFSTDLGLFAFDPALGGLLIAREGDLFDVGGGDLRTIADGGIGFLAGPTDDTLTALSNDGTLAFRLGFTDGTSGIFTAVIPEPASHALLGGAIVLSLRRRRRRAERRGNPARLCRK